MMENSDVILNPSNQPLPQVGDLAGKTIVAKIGGSTLGSEDTTLRDAATLARLGVRVVIVHGGGALISQWLNRVGIQARFVRGLRVTDTETMEVVTMVLAGKVNKELVAGIQASGGRAVGLCGVDGALFRARQLSADLGLVGEVTAVDPTVVESLLREGLTPVIAPIALGENGEVLNLNADTAAAELAVALSAEKLIFLTDVPGIRDDSGGLLPRLTSAEATELIARGTISGGMIPKAQACLRAIERVTAAHIIDGRVPGALVRELLSHVTVGTTIAKE